LSLGVPPATLDQPPDELHVESRLALRAPIAGTVVDRSLTLGQMVGGDASQRLYTIADLSQLWVNVDVYEKDLPLVRRGEAATVPTTAWPDERFRGAIDYVGDVVDRAARTVKIRIAVDNGRMLLKPEMFVTAELATAVNTAVLSVPLAAVHGEGSGH